MKFKVGDVVWCKTGIWVTGTILAIRPRNKYLIKPHNMFMYPTEIKEKNVEECPDEFNPYADR